MTPTPHADPLPIIEGFDASRAAMPTWNDVIARFDNGGWCWLATLAEPDLPQVRPVFCVWSDPVFYVASSETTRKSRNLATNPRCCVTKQADDLHIVIEADARKASDAASLHAAATAFDTTYGWPTTPSAGKLDAPYGAPTSGGPPYDIWAFTPRRAFAFPVEEGTFLPTRWRF